MIRRHTQTLRDSASQPSGTQSLLDSIEQRQQQLEDLKQHMESFQLNQQQQHQQQQQQQQQQQPSQSQQPQNSQSQQQQQPQPPPVVPAAPPTTTTLRPPILPKYLAEAMDRYQQEYDKLSDGDQELPSDDDMFL
uniref:Uncharacterized protein n=1 Tax=Panagrolaimus superbus TaxID=310955 RepID=A0A914Z3L0_9BILA